MGCLIAILIIAGIITLPSIFGPLIFWSLAAVIYWQGQNQRQTASHARQAASHAKEMKRIALLSAPPEVQKAEALREEEERKNESRLNLIKVGLVVVALIIIVLYTGHQSSTSTVASESPSPTPVETATPTSTIAESTPEPSATVTQPEVRKAIPVIASPTTTPYIEIPSPTDEEALAAFNDLQDQLSRSHIDHLAYSGTNDSYNWIGPKAHKKMSMKRRQFNEEVWQPYWKKTHQLQ
jgi:hypothetical protein